MPNMQPVSAPAAPPPPPAQPDPRLRKGPLYIMAPGSGLLTGGAQLVHQQQVQCPAPCTATCHPLHLHLSRTCLAARSPGYQ